MLTRARRYEVANGRSARVTLAQAREEVARMRAISSVNTRTPTAQSIGVEPSRPISRPAAHPRAVHHMLFTLVALIL